MNAVDNMGTTALHNAALNGHLEITKLLLRFGATLRENIRGDGPLDFALQNGHVEIGQV